MQRIDIGTYHIVYDDIWHRIEVNGRVLSLSPTQYRLCRLFLMTPPPPDMAGEMIITSYCSRNDLETKMALSHEMLIKHLSNLNARCAAIGLSLCAFRGGYILIVAPEAHVGY